VTNHQPQPCCKNISGHALQTHDNHSAFFIYLTVFQEQTEENGEFRLNRIRFYIVAYFIDVIGENIQRWNVSFDNTNRAKKVFVL
jgi:hypothetical protein